MSDYEVFTLTHLTRDLNESRRVTISGFEIQQKTFIICIAGFLPGVFVTLLAFPFFGINSILCIPLVIGIFFFFINYRVQSGLRLPLWDHIRTKKKSNVGTWVVAGQPVEPIFCRYYVISRSSVPVNGTVPYYVRSSRQ
jgi:uncharacterized membrane protein